MFSGRSGHPQGAGPYVLAQSTDKSFVVQVCHLAVRSTVSVNSGVAVHSAFGTAKFIGGRWHLSSGSQIVCSGGTCTFPNGEMVSASGSNVWVQMPSSYCDAVEGICGAFNPVASFADAFSDANGTAVSLAGQRYRWGGPFWGNYQYDFVESFKATAETTLFTQEECPLPTSQPRYEPTPPYASCPELQARAAEECPAGDRFNDCMMDVGETCELDPWTRPVLPPPGFVTPTPPPTPVAAPTPTPLAVPTPVPCGFDTCAGMAACDTTMRCSSGGDPHVTMFSGQKGHPMGEGPYVLAQSTDRSFEVQVCHRRVRPGISVNSAMAVRSSEYGSAKYVGSSWEVSSGSQIACSGATCRFPTGEVVSALAWVSLPSSYCSAVQGLCGNYNPDSGFADAFSDANGTVVSMVGQHYRWGGPFWGNYQYDFVESFKATADTSLFTQEECPLPTTPQHFEPTPPYASCTVAADVDAETLCVAGREHALRGG